MLTFPTQVEQEARELWCNATRARKRLASGMQSEAARAIHMIRLIGELTEYPTVARCAESTHASLMRGMQA